MLEAMGAERGSYRRERRNEAGKAARKLKDGEQETMFFGASPTQRQELRQTEDKKGIRVDRDLDMNAAMDRGKLGAPKKVGDNVRLIDIAMGNAPLPGPDAQRIGEAVPGEAVPVESKKAKRKAPKHSSRFARAASAGMQIALRAQEGISPHLQKLGWGAAALFTAAAFAAGPALASLAPELATEAAALRELGWQAARGEGLTALAAWARELGLALAALAAWFALAVRTWRAFRSPSKLVELARTLLLAGLPAVVLGGCALWLGGQLPLPWSAPAGLVEALRGALAPIATHLPIPLWQAAAGFVALVSLVVANGRRRRRPLQQPSS